MKIFSPLEQFELWPALSIQINFNPYLNFSPCYIVSNIGIASVICIVMTIFLFITVSSYKSIESTRQGTSILTSHFSFYFVPNPWQNLIEITYDTISQLVFDLVGTKGEKYFLFIITLFCFIFSSNLIGLIPFNFTVTTHLGTTLFLSFAIHNALQAKLVKTYGIQVFSFFLPPNTTFLLALLLVPIEYVSFFSRPISLGVRLFINILAGHTLLKVIVGFAWSMMMVDSFQMLSFLLPLLILILLMGLELAVAFIQTYVFITLTCIYINDSESLH